MRVSLINQLMKCIMNQSLLKSMKILFTFLSRDEAGFVKLRRSAVKELMKLGAERK